MAKTIGVVLSERVAAGLVVDHQIHGPVFAFPPDHSDQSALVEMHTEGLVKAICEQVILARGNHSDVTSVGVAMPGLIRDGVVEDSPNLPQLKGARIKDRLAAELKEHGLTVPVCILNDADGVAAGLAASAGKLDHFVRVWTLGIGIGYGRYPFASWHVGRRPHRRHPG